MPFDEKRAARAIRFIEHLPQTKGEWADKPFALLPWQLDMLSKLFGTIREDGTRQYRTCYCEIPRKNGKSTLAAGIALYMLFGDGEQGAEIYGAASDRDQASIVFMTAAEMVRRSSILAPAAKVIDSTKRIIFRKTGSFYRAIPADAAGSHGFNASGIILDEVHTQPNRDLYDVLNTSTGARRQPLIFAITTAGYDRNSICWELHDYALKVQNGVIDDPSFLPVLYFAEETDDWHDPKVWHKANPSLGQTVKEDYIEQECKRATEVPGYENTFRRLHLDQWTRQDTRWLSLESWDACGEAFDVADLNGEDCYVGIDLSSTTDLSAVSLLFPPSEDRESYVILPFFWLPGDNLEKRVRKDRVPYDVWERQGLIDLTPGNVIDYGHIRTKLGELAEQYNILEVGYDPWNAMQFVLELQGDGFNCVPVRQGYATLTNPTKELEKLVLGKGIRHGGHPILRWNIDNAVVTTDPAGNVKPDKAKATERIDGLIALIVALDRALRRETRGSIYEQEGILVL